MRKRTTVPLIAATLLISLPGFAQQASPPDGAVPPDPPEIQKGQMAVPGQPGVVEDKHAFGVLPNYRTAESSVPYTPITTAQKFKIATADTIDGPSFALAAMFSGLSQIDGSDPSFHQGVLGYAHRYITGLADQDIGNYMTEAIMPSLLHQDPRYFRKGTGSVKSRIWWATTRSVVTRTTSGNWTFNASEFLGNGVTASIGNFYYPDERGFDSTMQRMFTQIGTDTVSQVLKEFWPDVKRKFFHKEDGNVAAVDAK
jgi:hypothetical protein